MLTKLFIFGLLFVTQVPIKVVSGAAPEDKVPKVLHGKRKAHELGGQPLPEAKRSAISIVELPQEAVNQRTLDWVSSGISKEEENNLSCAQLEEKVGELGLLLVEETQERSGPICNLPLNPDKVIVDAKLIKSVKRQFDGLKSIHTDQIDDNFVGKMLVLPLKLKDVGGGALSLSIHGREYILVGGTVRIQDPTRNAVAYSTFALNEDGVLIKGYGNVPLSIESSSMSVHHMVGLQNVYTLPRYIEPFDHSETAISLLYEYLVYQDTVPLEPVYPVQPIPLLNSQVLSEEELIKELENKDIDSPSLISRAITLVRFIQIWSLIKADYAFHHPLLRTISSLLQELKRREVTEERVKAILVAACKFFCIDDQNFTLYNDQILRPLANQEPTIMEHCLTSTNDPFNHEAQIENVNCSTLSNTLLVHEWREWSLRERPYSHTITCSDDPDNPAIFKLVARIDRYGQLTTIGTGYNFNLKLPTFNLATYMTNPYFIGPHPIINNVPMLDSNQPLLSHLNGIYIYQRVEKERFKRMKVVSPPTD